MIPQSQIETALIPALMAVLDDIYQNDRRQGYCLLIALRGLLAKIEGHTDTDNPEIADICCKLADALDQAEESLECQPSAVGVGVSRDQ